MADSIKTARGDDQYMLRLPAGMRDEIKASADANGRSINAEIVARLVGHQSLRDKFAGQALTGLLAHPDHGANNYRGDTAHFAYLYADDMIAARKAGA
ncbi:Arc family DNA-binding protein [Agrobacterium tumefaciens]|uniref:Arc family DNA-binding protein n=1 Tax=Agrobacterium tumefaciens TaxID=358 RepID=UPI000470F398